MRGSGRRTSSLEPIQRTQKSQLVTRQTSSYFFSLGLFILEYLNKVGLRSFASTLPLGVSLASRGSFPRPRRCKLGSAACAPCWFYALWRARICEGVTVHSRWAGDFCRAAGACFLCLLLCLTLRQRRFQPVPVRPRHSDRKGSSRLRQFNRHGSCKQRHSKSPQHSFLPG